MKTAEYVEKIQKAINEDPEIKDKTHISVTAKERGILKGDEIHLVGKVNSASDKERALQIARSNVVKKMEVVDELIVVEEKV
jgi:osmotically-inducible protein OsmY